MEALFSCLSTYHHKGAQGSKCLCQPWKEGTWGENKHGIWRQIYSLPGFADHLSMVVVCFISPARYRAEGEILVLSVRNGRLQESVGWILLEEKEAETLNS